MRDDTKPDLEIGAAAASPGVIGRVRERLAAVPWSNAASGKWWWRWFRRSMMQSGRVTTILLLFALMVYHLDNPYFLELLRARVFDAYQQVKPRAMPAEQSVVIIDIDEKSIAEIGQW